MTSFPVRAALALMLTASALPAFAADAKDPVVAVVNGKEIRKSALEEVQQTMPQARQLPIEVIYDQLLDHMINGQLLLVEGQKLNLQDDPKVKQKLKAVQERLVQEAYLQKRIEAEVSDSEMKARYDDLLKQTPPREEVRARHILVDSEDAAKQVLAELAKGAKFEDLAKTKSKDSGAAKNGGDLGFFGKEDMVPEFSAAAFAMKPGEVSKTAVKSQFGYHIIKVEEKRTAPPPKFDEVKENIKAEIAEKKIGDILGGLRDKAKVQRFALDGSPLPDKPAAAPKAPK